ncbi:hypothetical protein BV898_11338 [Hypsibius exemplaris]|uniref:non-specific serine/threonine protein kinase n=1 Tax=Hypsibius exemplaris TaxID=2072580 RepID=A0A1W0WH13_HYPEX|nr:hypothetical protein BV898_11338 [Hypsibius exemplaris]
MSGRQLLRKCEPLDLSSNEFGVAFSGDSLFVYEEVTSRFLEEELNERLVRIVGLHHVNLVKYHAFGLHRLPDSLATGSENRIQLGVLLDVWGNSNQSDNQKQSCCSDSLREFSFKKFIQTHPLTVDRIMQYTIDLLEALIYLHNQVPPITLGTLRTQSIILTDTGSLKILDLINPIHFHNDSEKWREFLRSEDRLYAHPDVVELAWSHVDNRFFPRAVTIGMNADFWSLGCVILDMFTQGKLQHTDKDGDLIPEQADERTFWSAITNKGRPFIPFIPGSAPQIIQQVCKLCFDNGLNSPKSAGNLLMYITMGKKGTNDSEIPALTNIPLFSYSTPTDPDRQHTLHYRWVGPAGDGAFGEVHKIAITDSSSDPSKVTSGYEHQILALKVLKGTLSLHQSATLVQLVHKNVVKYIACGEISIGSDNMRLPAPKAAVLMEYYSGGNLNNLAEKGELKEKDILRYSRQIANGLQYLHGLSHSTLSPGKPVFHGDLKGENVFLTDNRRTCKIGDMENHHLVKLNKEGRTATCGLQPCQGSLHHMSPEVLAYAANKSAEGRTFIGRASDIWSFGCVILELFNQGSVPYFYPKTTAVVAFEENNKKKQLLDALNNGAHPDFSLRLKSSSIYPTLRKITRRRLISIIVERCVSMIPEHRPKAAQIYEVLTKIQDNVQKGQAIRKRRPPIPNAPNVYFLYSNHQNSEAPRRQKLRITWANNIGYGGFADIYSIKAVDRADLLALTSEDYETLTLKIIRLVNPDFYDPSGVSSLLSLRHPNIVRYFACGEVPVGADGFKYPKPRSAILMEHFSGGDLHNLWKTDEMNEQTILYYLQQVTNGLKFMHGENQSHGLKPIFHAHLKGVIMFLTHDRKTCKIGNYDNVYLLGHDQASFEMPTRSGTVVHMAPEMLKHFFENPTNKKCELAVGLAGDIWSVGCIVLEMLGKGDVKYRTAEEDAERVVSSILEQYIGQVADGAHPDQTVAEAAGMSPELRRIVSQCLQRDPLKRPTATELWNSVVALERQTRLPQGSAATNSPVAS